MDARVIFISTFDTKGIESDYIKKRIEENGVLCTTVDVGVGGEPAARPDISLADLCKDSPYTVDQIHRLPRGEAVAVVSGLVQQYAADIYAADKMSAVIGIGGAGGTQIVTQTMRTLPFGLPKLMLSTLASGNTRWYLEDSDISIMPSIADVAGLNCVTRLVFDRFAALAAESAKWFARSYDTHMRALQDRGIPRIGQTMYGTTTKGVTRAREALERRRYETIVFHASGAGGQAMERFIRAGTIHGVLDMTLAEIGGHLVGGLHNAGPNRLDAAIETGIPLVLIPGAADTIVLPPFDDLPERFKNGRTLNYHNPTMTTMRTNVEENIQIGSFIVSKLKPARGPVKVILPKGGLSSIDKPGAVFHFPEANDALFETIKAGLRGTNIEVIEDDRHLNDAGFGEDAAALLDAMMQHHRA